MGTRIQSVPLGVEKVPVMAVGITGTGTGTGTFADTDYNRQADDASAGRLRLLRGSKRVSEANDNETQSKIATIRNLQFLRYTIIDCYDTWLCHYENDNKDNKDNQNNKDN